MKAKRGQSASFLKELRRKHGLGEFAKDRPARKRRKVSRENGRLPSYVGPRFA